MIAVVGHDRVVGVGCCPYHRHLAQFLANTGMGGSGEKSLAKQIHQQPFGSTDQNTEGVKLRGDQGQDRFAMNVPAKQGFVGQVGLLLIVSLKS